MDHLSVMVAVICLLHCVIFFFDLMFKSCSHVPYLTFLHATGMQVELMRLKWFTTLLNRPLQKWGVWRPRFLQAWFTVGTMVSLMLSPVALFIVIRMGISALGIDSPESDAHPVMILEPLVPGINLPISEIGYYVITLIVCSFVHEVGHAVAAVREDVHICGIGFFLVIIFPVACVYLDSDQMSALVPLRRLRILCAGIWHNIVLSIFSALFLIALPWLAHPFYYSGQGVQVLVVSPKSSIAGPLGLQAGDVVTSISECSVTSIDSWHTCLRETVRNPTPGYCTVAEFVREHDESVPEHAVAGGGIECCGTGSLHLGYLCFQLVDESGGPVELPEHSCLSARSLVEQQLGLCGHGSSPECTEGLHCLRPALANSTKLITLQRTEGKMVLFIGHAVEIYQAVAVSDFVSRWSFLSSEIPQAMVEFSKYFTTLSAGLAIVNILPCFFFDGQHIVAAISDILLIKYVPDKNMRSAIALCTTMLGTMLLIVSFFVPLVHQFI